MSDRDDNVDKRNRKTRLLLLLLLLETNCCYVDLTDNRHLYAEPTRSV